VHFYENRFELALSPQDELDLFNFLRHCDKITVPL
jgi:hypothetical protein